MKIKSFLYVLCVALCVTTLSHIAYAATRYTNLVVFAVPQDKTEAEFSTGSATIKDAAEAVYSNDAVAANNLNTYVSLLEKQDNLVYSDIAKSSGSYVFVKLDQSYETPQKQNVDSAVLQKVKEMLEAKAQQNPSDIS